MNDAMQAVAHLAEQLAKERAAHAKTLDVLEASAKSGDILFERWVRNDSAMPWDGLDWVARLDDAEDHLRLHGRVK